MAGYLGAQSSMGCCFGMYRSRAIEGFCLFFLARAVIDWRCGNKMNRCSLRVVMGDIFYGGGGKVWCYIIVNEGDYMHQMGFVYVYV